jgi:hypothetical protein
VPIQVSDATRIRITPKGQVRSRSGDGAGIAPRVGDRDELV